MAGSSWEKRTIRLFPYAGRSTSDVKIHLEEDEKRTSVGALIRQD